MAQTVGFNVLKFLELKEKRTILVVKRNGLSWLWHPRFLDQRYWATKTNSQFLLPSTVFFPNALYADSEASAIARGTKKLHSQSPRIVEEIHTVHTLSGRSTSESKMPASQNRLSIAKMRWQKCVFTLSETLRKRLTGDIILLKSPGAPELS